MKPGLVDVEALIQDASELEPPPASTTRLASIVTDEDSSLEEIAETMGVSISTVERDWRVARAWLFRKLGDDDGAAAK